MSDDLVFPLPPRRRVEGRVSGTMRSRARGPGFDLAGSRPYRTGDDVRRIDWRASARLSSVRDDDEFVVREHLTEESTRVVVVTDRSPSMALFPPGFPWLSKPAAVAEAEALITGSARVAGCPVGGVTLRDGEGLEEGLGALSGSERRLPPGTLVFLLSDFLRPPGDESFAEALAHGWDVVAIVVQDPLWEQSFPDVAGAVLPLADPASGRLARVRLTRSEASARRDEHRRRLAGILARCEALGLDWALVSSHERGDVLEALLDWSHGRHQGARLVR